jgi:hypothetical protein
LVILNLIQDPNFSLKPDPGSSLPAGRQVRDDEKKLKFLFIISPPPFLKNGKVISVY